MGNQLIKGYSIDKEPKGQCGFNGIWKMYDATKHGTNQPVTIWMIDKKSLKKSDREETLKMAKKESTSLAKFRHPGILSISEMPLEDEYSLAFVTERIEGNLSHFMKTQKTSEICSSQLEIRIQLSGLLETLNFLHTNVKMAHLAINPDNIYVSPGGKWKLGGFLFAQNISSTSPGGLQPMESYSRDMSYFAPEMVQDKCCFSSDTFSLMVLVINLIRIANEKTSGSQRQLITANTRAEYEKHQEIIKRIESHPYISESNNPDSLAKLARQSLSWNPESRISMSQLANCEWLNDNFILTIRHLDNITSLEQKRQFQFIKGLEQILFKFEPSVIKKRIIPALLGLLKFDYLIAAVVITLVQVMKKEAVSVGQFQKNIWSELRNVTVSKEIPAHALYTFVDNVDVFAKYLSLQDLNASIIPLFLKCFDCPNKLKELALKKVQFLLTKLDYQFLKTKVLPRLLNLLVDKTEMIRKYSVIVIFKCVNSFDIQAIEQILAALQKSRKMGQDSFFNAITLKLYSSFAKQMSIQQIGDKIIPSLLPYLVDPSLTKNEFDLYKSTILFLINRIEDVRSKNFTVNDGHIYTEADFDFPKDKQQIRQPSAAQSPQASSPNFEFLNLFNQQQQSSQNTAISSSSSVSPKSDGINFSSNGHSSAAQFSFETPSGFSPISIPTQLDTSAQPQLNQSPSTNSPYSPPNLQKTNSTQMYQGINNKPATNSTSTVNPVLSSAPVFGAPKSVDQASQDFFSGLGGVSGTDSPNKSKLVMRGPPKQNTVGMLNPPNMNPQKSNPTPSLNMTPSTTNSYLTNPRKIQTDDPFAELEAEGGFIKSNSPAINLGLTLNSNASNGAFGGLSQQSSGFQPSFNIGNLGGPQQQPQFSLDFGSPNTTPNTFMVAPNLNNSNMNIIQSQPKPAPKKLVPPTTNKSMANISNIKGDDFFDLL